MAWRDYVVTAQNGPSVTHGLLLRMFRPLGPKTLREVCAEVARSLPAFGIHFRTGHHGQVSLLPTQAMGASTGLLLGPSSHHQVSALLGELRVCSVAGFL